MKRNENERFLFVPKKLFYYSLNIHLLKAYKCSEICGCLGGSPTPALDSKCFFRHHENVHNIIISEYSLQHLIHDCRFMNTQN